MFYCTVCGSKTKVRKSALRLHRQDNLTETMGSSMAFCCQKGHVPHTLCLFNIAMVCRWP